MNKMVRMIKQQNVVTAKQSQSALIEGLKKKEKKKNNNKKYGGWKPALDNEQCTEYVDLWKDILNSTKACNL